MLILCHDAVLGLQMRSTYAIGKRNFCMPATFLEAAIDLALQTRLIGSAFDHTTFAMPDEGQAVRVLLPNRVAASCFCTWLAHENQLNICQHDVRALTQSQRITIEFRCRKHRQTSASRKQSAIRCCRSRGWSRHA